MLSEAIKSAASIRLKQRLRHEHHILNCGRGARVRNGNCYCGEMSAVKSRRCKLDFKTAYTPPGFVRTSGHNWFFSF